MDGRAENHSPELSEFQSQKDARAAEAVPDDVRGDISKDAEEVEPKAKEATDPEVNNDNDDDRSSNSGLGSTDATDKDDGDDGDDTAGKEDQGADTAQSIPEPTEEEKALQYLNNAGVLHTISSMVQELLKKSPQDDVECRLLLIRWLASRLPLAQLKTRGIKVDETLRLAEESPYEEVENDFECAQSDRREQLLRQLENKYLEVYNIDVAKNEAGMTHEDLENYIAAFRALDTEGTGRLTIPKIVSIAKQFGLDPSRKKIATATPQFERMHEGTVNLCDFLKMMRALDPDRDKEAALAMGHPLDEYDRLNSTFLDLDEENSGELMLSIKQIIFLMQRIG